MSMQRQAISIIQALTLKLSEGMIINGKVVRTIPIGAFVELAPGKDGMVHISQLSKERTNRVEDVVNIGDKVIVKIMNIDDKGRVNLTIKGVTPEEKAQFE